MAVGLVLLARLIVCMLQVGLHALRLFLLLRLVATILAGHWQLISVVWPELRAIGKCTDASRLICCRRRVSCSCCGRRVSCSSWRLSSFPLESLPSSFPLHVPPVTDPVRQCAVAGRTPHHQEQPTEPEADTNMQRSRCLEPVGWHLSGRCSTMSTQAMLQVQAAHADAAPPTAL
jgi:hypothetical protein